MEPPAGRVSRRDVPVPPLGHARVWGTLAPEHGVQVGTTKEAHDAVAARWAAVEKGLDEAICALAARAAEASSPFALAPSATFISLSRGFLADVEALWNEAVRGLDVGPERGPLAAAWRLERAYLQGMLDGGVVALALHDGFPDGDWDEVEPVTDVLRKRFAFLGPRLRRAMEDGAQKAAAASKAARRPKASPSPEKKTPRPAAKSTPKTARGTSAPKAAAAGTPKADASQKAGAAKGGDGKERLRLLLAYAGELGVRIRKIPKRPSAVWLDKLQAKLEEIGEKRGIPSPFSFREEDERGTAETMAFQLPDDEATAAARQQRLEQMLVKAERAGLKLGSLPERPSDAYLTDLEQKLDAAMEKRRRERRERRERLARQRKERIARLQAYAAELGIDLGRIPPFPTEDWIARAELRVASQMLPQEPGVTDRGRRERLATLLARASDAGIELEVPPDPDEVWLGWAESQVDRALGGGDALAAEEDPDDRSAPTLLFEEGTVQEQRWVIEEDRFTIGRARNNHAQIRHDGQLSRQHCAIERDGDGWVIRDLRSTQGTKLNGEPVRGAVPLRDGDVITIGETRLVFRLP